MAWEDALYNGLGKLFTFISWPSFTLICPLFASIQAIEGNSSQKNHQCLTFWVLFALITILELALAKILEWLPYWPYVKGVAIVLLVIPYFSGASYVYKHFRGAYFSESPKLWSFFFIPCKKDIMLSEQNNSLVVADTNFINGGAEELKKLIFEGVSEPCYDRAERDYIWPTSPEKVQKEWSCALCQISTTSEKCLKKHLRGKKHKAKEEELRADDSNIPNRTNRMVLLGKLNQIASGFPGSIGFCRWEKPGFGWTKLNTDGSIDPGNAGFGGILRDYKGNPICAFVSKASWDDIFMVELWAIWRGLVLALRLGVKLVWVESDSMSVVKTINREQHYRPKADGYLKNIWELLKQFEKYKVSHSWRETNRAADHLSKMVLAGSDVVLWPADFPDSLRNIIRDDAQGRIYRRA